MHFVYHCLKSKPLPDQIPPLILRKAFESQMSTSTSSMSSNLSVSSSNIPFSPSVARPEEKSFLKNQRHSKAYEMRKQTFKNRLSTDITPTPTTTTTTTKQHLPEENEAKS